jgi:putative membrane protein
LSVIAESSDLTHDPGEEKRHAMTKQKQDKRPPPLATARSSWRIPIALLSIFAAFWTWLAIAPTSRGDWMMENALTAIAIPLLVFTRNKLRLSNAAYVCLFVFFCLHTVGSHYTYSLVPYDAWWQSLTGRTLNSYFGFERNHYDRLVHFLYGALIVVPSLELFIAYAPPKKAWRILMPIFFIMAHSVVYEMIEWLAALAVAPELGQAYLGTQGDAWDAQKDMALATGGAIVTMLLMRWSPMWKHRFVIAK